MEESIRKDAIRREDEIRLTPSQLRRAVLLQVVCLAVAVALLWGGLMLVGILLSPFVVLAVFVAVAFALLVVAVRLGVSWSSRFTDFLVGRWSKKGVPPREA